VWFSGGSSVWRSSRINYSFESLMRFVLFLASSSSFMVGLNAALTYSRAEAHSMSRSGRLPIHTPDPTPPEVRPPPESPHESLKSKIMQIGEVLGKKYHVEFPLDNYQYDVVWKEIEGLLPSHVFEVQDKGNVDLALSKLQHAQHKWRPTGGLFFVVTEEKDRNKVDLLLRPYLEGTFHKIAGRTIVLTPDVVDQIHATIIAHAEVVRRFIED